MKRGTGPHAAADSVRVGAIRGRLPFAVIAGAFLLLAAIATPVAASTAASSPPVTGATSAGSIAPTFAGVPTATQTNISPYPVLQHLGRWDGTTFQPVPAGSIAGGHVVFMSHGWSPGFLAPFQALQAKSTTLVTAWTPGLVNAAGQSLMDTWVPVAQALQAGDPGATIVFFSWVDQSATSDDPLEARVGEQATEVNGHRLGTAIEQALAPGFYAAGGQVHLLGHSFGANVATTAALSLTVAPRQLTLLDSPETEIALLGGAKNDLRYKLPRLDIGRGPGQTFVDNYISYVGIRFAGFPGLDQVVDVQTAPPPSDSPGDKHSFAIVWYRTSAQTMSAGVGYAWSPLLGANDQTLGSYYLQPDPTKVLALNEVNGVPPAGVRTQMLVSTAAMDVPGADATRAGVPGTAAARSGDQPIGSTGPPAPLTSNGVRLGGSSPTTWNLTFSTDENSLWLDFDATLDGTAGDLLSVFVDGRQRSVAAVGPGTGAAGSFVILYDVSPGDHVLSAVLSGPSSSTPPDPTSTASLTRLRMSSTADIQRNLTPDETNGLIIAALVIVLLVFALLIGFIVFVIRRLRRLTRHHPDVENDSAVADDDGDESRATAENVESQDF